MATGRTTKVAWIHDGEPGQRSLGHFNCPCGEVVRDVEYADGHYYACVCGVVYDSKGRVVR